MVFIKVWLFGKLQTYELVYNDTKKILYIELEIKRVLKIERI